MQVFQKVIALALGLLGIAQHASFAAYPVHDAQNIAQARLLVNVGNNQVSTLGNILGVNNEQLLMLEKIYKSLGNPQSVNRSDIKKANSIIEKNGLSSFLDSAAGSTFSDLGRGSLPKRGDFFTQIEPNLSKIFDSGNLPGGDLFTQIEPILSGNFEGVMENFLGSNFNDFKRFILNPKKEIGQQVSANVSSRIADLMNLPPGVEASLEDYLQDLDGNNISSNSVEFANNVAAYYFGKYMEQAGNRMGQTATLKIKNTAISDEIKDRIASGSANLNQQFSGLNELQATQNEILLNTSNNLNEANAALLNTQNSQAVSSRETLEFEKQKARIGRLNNL